MKLFGIEVSDSLDESIPTQVCTYYVVAHSWVAACEWVVEFCDHQARDFKSIKLYDADVTILDN
jgi:hypothetical protein